MQDFKLKSGLILRQILLNFSVKITMKFKQIDKIIHLSTLTPRFNKKLSTLFKLIFAILGWVIHNCG